MTRRTMTAERAAALRSATTASVMDHLRRVRGNVPAHLLAQGLAAATAEIICQHVAAKNRAATFERVRAIIDAAETVRGRTR